MRSCHSLAIRPSCSHLKKFIPCYAAALGIKTHSALFYEWVRTATVKQPFCFEVNKGKLFAFAKLWEGWRDPSGQWVKSCSVLTTTPNAVTSQVHDRMPVILSKDAYELWLDPELTDVASRIP
jgi:putative SOS response-associated peptidase YedK